MNDYSNKWANYKRVNMSFDPQYIEDIDTLLDLLHLEQLGMIDRAVELKEVEGFAEANEIINHIRKL